jgi:hypothetical protein
MSRLREQQLAQLPLLVAVFLRTAVRPRKALQRRLISVQDRLRDRSRQRALL